MKIEKTLEMEIGSYISALLRNYFGKGPNSLYVTIKPPFFTIHFRGLITPTEKVLIKQKKWRHVLEIRDLLMIDLKEEIRKELWKIAKLEVNELYADWNMEMKSGLIIGIINSETTAQDFNWPAELVEQEFQNELIKASLKAEKNPGRREVYWLNDRTILVKRSEVLVPIEKELIKKGYEKELMIAKKQLESKIFQEVQLETTLQRKITEHFFFWNFEQDGGYVVFIVDPAETISS